MRDIKPIETAYKGYRFRSRLETRWAVFFDALGVDWAYEPQGFETSAGWYLPDFLVQGNGFSAYVEVRPVWAPDARVKALHRSLGGRLTGEGKFGAGIVAGDPWEWFIQYRDPDTDNPVWMQLENIEMRLWQALPVNATGGLKREILEPCALKARQARFEHGESPK